jgi:hypothetical protein
LTRSTLRRPIWRLVRIARGAPGFVAVAAAALLIATAGARAIPSSLAQSGTPEACVPPVGSPEASPDASPAIDALQDIGATITGGTPPATEPPPCPTEPVPTNTPSIEDQLATAAALAQTATAIAQPPTPTPPPTATPPPQVGEVAEALPPVDLPVTNPQGYSFNLEASLTAGFESVAAEAPVYRLTPVALNAEQVQALSDGLGIGGAVVDRGNGNFAVSGNGQLLVTPTLVQYLSPAQPGEGDLPDDQQAVDIARDWLRSSGLVQPDLGEGKVVSRVDEARRVVVVFSPAEPANLLAAYPSISVSLGPNGDVLEAASRWPTIQRAELYALRPAEEAWRQVESGQAYVEASLEGAGFEEGSVISGLVRYDRIEIAYTTAGPPGGTQFLAPVYMFTGSLTPEGRSETYPVRAYVPALAVGDTPVGFVPGAPIAAAKPESVR